MSERWSDFSPFCGLFLGKKTSLTHATASSGSPAKGTGSGRPTRSTSTAALGSAGGDGAGPPGATGRSREGSNVASRQVRPHSLDLLSSEVERSPKGPFGALCKISLTSPALKPDQG
jgi:hypothetical protein